MIIIPHQATTSNDMKSFTQCNLQKGRKCTKNTRCMLSFILWRIWKKSATKVMSTLFNIQKSIWYFFWTPKSIWNKFVEKFRKAVYNFTVLQLLHQDKLMVDVFISFQFYFSVFFSMRQCNSWILMCFNSIKNMHLSWNQKQNSTLIK